MARDIFPSPQAIPEAPRPLPQSPTPVSAAGQGGAEPQQGGPDLMVFYRAIMQRKWIILFFSIMVACLTYGVVKLQTPIYTASAKLLLDTSDIKTVGIEEVYDPAASKSREFVNTQLQIMRSPEVLNRVIDRLGLSTHPLFDPRQKKPSAIEKQIRQFVTLPADKQEFSNDQVRRTAASILRSNLAAEPVRGSQIVAISYSSADPKLSATIANTLADALIENDLDAKFQMTQQANSWMNERLGSLKQDLAESEKQLQAFRDKKGLVDTSGVIAQASAQLSGTMSQLIEARAERARLESAYRRVRQLGDEVAALQDEPVVARTGTVIAAKGTLVAAQRNLAEVSDRYGPQHPTYQKADAEVRAAQTSFQREVQLAAAQIQKDYETANATVRAIEQTVNQAKGQVRAVNKNEFQLAALEREVDSNRQLYDLFLSRLKETSATDGLQRTMGRVVEPAISGYQTFPKPALFTGGAFVVALLLGCGMAVLLVALDSTVKTTEEVERRLLAPVLGTVPISKNGGRGVTTILNEPMGIFAESFRTIRTGVLLSELDSERVVLSVTSSVPGEGKSTVSANFAMVQSQTKKTLLIDADMRRPTLGKDLLMDSRRDRRTGLSDLISGQVELDEVVRKVPDTELDCISAGSAAPNPLDLLTSPRFHAVLEELKQRYEVIVIDTPPVRLVSDALIIGEQCTSMVYVVQSDKTPYKLAQRGLSEVRKAGIRVLGVVLNRQDLKKADRYYGEYSGYAGYGYKSYYGADRAI